MKSYAFPTLDLWQIFFFKLQRLLITVLLIISKAHTGSRFARGFRRTVYV
jgi:hypothetical protein